jgi:hypothetical protein
MKIYNVIWIDDQWEDQQAFLIDAEQEGIDITPFTTSKSGMLELERYLYRWDGVILDAKVFNESEDEVAKITGLTNSIKKIHELYSKRKIPYFVYTGQPDLLSSDLFEDMIKDTGYYRKPADRDKLFSDIKNHANKQLETQIRHKYADVFEVCSDEYLGASNKEKLLRILVAYEQNETNNPLYFNEIRKITESLFNCCSLKGLFPEDCTETNARSFFLGRKEMQVYVPVYIQRNIHSVVVISQEGSHRLTIDNDVQEGKSPYLFKSTVMELLNIILWYKQISDEHPDGIRL